MVLKFYSTVTKIELKVRTFSEPIATFRKVTRENMVGGAFWPPSS